MFENISKLDVYAALAINGIFSGLGAAIGTWLGQRHIISRFENIAGKFKRQETKK